MKTTDFLKEYKSWQAMNRRCTDTKLHNYDRYGGRGIRVCEAWKDFWVFLADMGPRPDGMTIDRRDNNGNYEPGNCRWADKSTQSKNRSGRRVGRVPLDLTGRKFGMLTAIAYVRREADNKQIWLTQCDCGTESLAIGRQMVRGYKSSCGCLRPNNPNRWVASIQ